MSTVHIKDILFYNGRQLIGALLPEGGRGALGLPRALALMAGPPSLPLPAGDAIGDGTPDVVGDNSCMPNSDVAQFTSLCFYELSCL